MTVFSYPTVFAFLCVGKLSYFQMQMDKPLASSTLSPLHKYKNHITEVDATLNLEVVKFWRFFCQ